MIINTKGIKNECNSNECISKEDNKKEHFFFGKSHSLTNIQNSHMKKVLRKYNYSFMSPEDKKKWKK
jgi:hypothetical protein